MPWFTLPVTHLLLLLYEKCYITSFSKRQPPGALNPSIQNSSVTRLAGMCSLWKGSQLSRAAGQRHRKAGADPGQSLAKEEPLWVFTLHLCLWTTSWAEKKRERQWWQTWLKLFLLSTSLLPLFLSCALDREIKAGLPLEWETAFLKGYLACPAWKDADCFHKSFYLWPGLN